MRRRRRRTVIVALLGLATAGCGSAAGTRASSAPRADMPTHWRAYLHLRRPLDLAGPRPDGSLILAANGRLWRLLPSGSVDPFAPAYNSPGGEEPYIAMPAPGHRGCSFGAAVYALRLRAHGVLKINPSGPVRTFAPLAAGGLIDGIAFDETGGFGRRLLVTISAGSHTTLDAVSCHGAVTTITRSAPKVEGGIAVAPLGFGRFAGDVIAPDEISGRIYAITPTGATSVVADSGLPHGQDVGVESEAFIPARKRYSLLVADRLTPGNRHPGDDELLRIGSATLGRAGVRAGSLLVTTEGGARTDSITCQAAGCRVLHVADGPAIAHIEGHIAVAPL